MEKLAKEILAKIGGKENVTQAWHCMTRLRFNVKDDSKVSLDEIEKLQGVVGVRQQNGQYQVIIGNNVSKVYEFIDKEIGDMKVENSKAKGNILNQIIEIIAGLFNPILPAIVGTGLLKALLSLVVIISPTAVETGTYQIFAVISEAAFYFLPFLLATSAAKKFNVDVSLTVVVAGAMMYPTILNNAGQSVSFLGVNLPFLDYNSTVIPIILSIILLKYVDQFFKKIIPEMFRYVFTPMLTLCVTIPISLIVLAPLGNYISIYFAQGINWLFINVAPLAGLVYVGLMPLIIMTGMHYAFFPTAIQSIETIGYDLVLLPANLIHNAAQAGAAFAVSFKTKNKDVKSVALSTGVSAVFGITEPAMYGINLKYKKPFYAVMISGGIVGAVAVTLGLKASTFATPGILALPGYSGSSTANLILAIGSYVASFGLAFIITLIWKFEIEPETPLKTIDIAAPVDGEVVELSQVNDKVFSDKLMGDGFAIIPNGDTYYAPFDGTVKMVFNTKHALAFESKEGIEVLYHIGLDTANLQGKYFDVLVEEGQAVLKGQPVVTINRNALLTLGYDLITPVVITNSDNVIVDETSRIFGQISMGQSMLKVEKKEEK